MDQVEKYIMTRLYKSVFCPETTDDEKKDLTTQNRIRWASLDPKSGSGVFIIIIILIYRARLMTRSGTIQTYSDRIQ